MSDLIAEEIRVALTRQRMSQRQFAAKLGVSPAWLNYRLTGVQEIGVNDLNRIAKALGLSVFDLMPSREDADRAADPGLTARYPSVAVRPAFSGRPRDNRPNGRPGPAVTALPTRTAYLDRGKPRRRDR